MSKTILIKGKPSSGKTFLVRKLKDYLQINIPHEFIGSQSHNKYIYYSNDKHVYIIGRYDNNVYGGLDCFNPKSEAVEMTETLKWHDNYVIVLFCKVDITF